MPSDVFLCFFEQQIRNSFKTVIVNRFTAFAFISIDRVVSVDLCIFVDIKHYKMLCFVKIVIIVYHNVYVEMHNTQNNKKYVIVYRFVCISADIWIRYSPSLRSRPLVIFDHCKAG